MLYLNAGRSLPITVSAGNSLVVKVMSGAVIVSGGFQARDCSESHGAGAVAYGPVPTDTTLTLSTTGDCYYGVFDGVLADSPAGDIGSYMRKSIARGAYYPKTTRLGTYGRKIANWSALQGSAGTAEALTTTDLPPRTTSTKVLKLTHNATPSYGQQNPIDGSQPYMPTGDANGYFNVGVWVKNPQNRTMNFELRVYNAAQSNLLLFNCAVEPAALFPETNGWVFLTVSHAQRSASGWVYKTDSIAYVRVTQKTSGPEGNWASGEYLLIGDVYADVKARPRLMFTFDDGFKSQRHPSGAAGGSAGSSYVVSTSTNTLTTNAAHNLRVSDRIRFVSGPPTSLSLWTTYYVKTVPTSTTFTLTTDEALTTDATTTGYSSGTAEWVYAGSQARSMQEMVEEHGFRGSVFVVGKWLGTSGKWGYLSGTREFMSAGDVVDMYNEGWTVGNHSWEHPSNNDSGGLRLLGPYGYYLSNLYDNMPAQYLTNWSLNTTTGRRRVTGGTQASPSVFTTENAHLFLINQPIEFTDVAPTGCSLGVTYYVATIPSSTTFTLATDPGTLTSTVNNTTGAWSGTANYKYPGSRPDDSAIYNDIVRNAEYLASIGIPTGHDFFALPQGSADEYVRSACIRAGIKWVRGVSTHATSHTVPVGSPTGGNLTSVQNFAGGWIKQLDAIALDGGYTLAQLGTYITDVVSMGYSGCCYHHELTAQYRSTLEYALRKAKENVDAGALDVLTVEEHCRDLGIIPYYS